MKIVLESQGLEEEKMMGKETERIMYDEATISKMLNMFMEMKEKMQQALVLQGELAWLLYAGARPSKCAKTIIPSIPGMEDRRRHTYETEEEKPPSKPIKLTSEVKVDKKYSFCNSEDTSMWHIRRMTDGGSRTPSSTRSLCDEQVFWDEYITLLVVEDNIGNNVCMQCAVKYRRIQGEQYVNKETDQHKEEG